MVWVVGSVLPGSGCAVRVGGSGGCPRGCPPWGPVPWSRVLSGSLPLVLGVAAVSSSSSGACAVACPVALAAAAVVAWRRGRGGWLRGSILGDYLGRCSPFFPCGGALLPLCGVRWSVGVSWCGSCGVRSVVRPRVLAGLRLLRLGLGRCWSFRCGVPFLCVRPSSRRCALSLCATAHGPSPSWPFDGILPLRCVASGALSLWAPACYLGPLLAPLPGFPFPSLALPLPLPFPFPLWWWWGRMGVCGASMAHALGWVVWSHRRRVEGVWGGAEALDRFPKEGF